ncbi:uncharacterized protein LOC134192219 isoform X2 [Corticium candelabrum]|uniref:uncharacterized protein LOC134192219 isoform X2 n=1 Tax=Corticium candelabrum TaxID=121492 RepID=UPI002E25863D|nr:uncharacterized protein LOC134192219 isoform X2 [Corticium candelabrum]
MSVPNPSQYKYFENFLEKKEKKWIQYWVVLIGNRLCFFKDNQTQVQGHLIGRLELHPQTRIMIGKTKKNNYQFQVTTAKGVYLLKAASEKLRGIWMQKISLASKGQLPGAPRMQPNSGQTVGNHRHPQPGQPSHMQPGYPSRPPQLGYPSHSQPGYPPYSQPGYPPHSQPGYPPHQQRSHSLPGHSAQPPPTYPLHSQPGYPTQFQPGHLSYSQPPHHQQLAYRGYVPQPQPGTYPRPLQQRPLPQEPGECNKFAHGPSADTRRRVSAPQIDMPPALPTSPRPSAEYAMLLPGQRIALEEEQREKERKLKASRSEGALRQRPTSVTATEGPYVPMSPVSDATATAATLDEVVTKGETSSTSKSEPFATVASDDQSDNDADYVTPWEDAEWFYSPLSRDAAEDLLKYKGTVGSFLVRDSESASGDYSLSVRNDDKIRHYKITNATGGFAVVGVSDVVFKDLFQLVQFYIASHEGRLQPLLRDSKQILQSSEPSQISFDEEDEKSAKDYIQLFDEMGEDIESPTLLNPPEPEEPPDTLSDDLEDNNASGVSSLPVLSSTNEDEMRSKAMESNDSHYFVMTKNPSPEKELAETQIKEAIEDITVALSTLEQFPNLEVEGLTEESDVRTVQCDKAPSSSFEPLPSEPPTQGDDQDDDVVMLTMPTCTYPDLAKESSIGGGMFLIYSLHSGNCAGCFDIYSAVCHRTVKTKLGAILYCYIIGNNVKALLETDQSLSSSVAQVEGYSHDDLEAYDVPDQCMQKNESNEPAKPVYTNTAIQPDVYVAEDAID